MDTVKKTVGLLCGIGMLARFPYLFRVTLNDRKREKWATQGGTGAGGSRESLEGLTH